MTEFLTALGAAIAIFLSSAGASLGSIPAGVFALRANRTWGWKSFIPIVIAGVLAIYGLIIAVILCGNVDQTQGYKHLCAGLAVGSACLASGLGMGKFIHIQTPDAPKVRVDLEDCTATTATEPLLGHGNESTMVSGAEVLRTVCVLAFIEAIALYGLIVALILVQP